MRPFYTQVTDEYDYAITIRFDEHEKLEPRWHYHDEYELVYVNKGEGVRFIGDAITPFAEGDLVLLGKKLPHVWINKNNAGKYTPCALTVIHLKPIFFDNDFFRLSLMSRLNNLLKDAERGVSFNEINPQRYLQKIKELEGEKRILAVMELLVKLLDSSNVEFVSSQGYNAILQNQQSGRLMKVHNYIVNHFREKIDINELASLVPMTKTAFCAYFKKQCGKSAMAYINDMRIGYSCRLLAENKMTIEHIAQSSGFNSTTFFNRKFKDRMGMTPKVYRRAHG